LFALCLLSSIATVTLPSAPAAAQRQSYFNDGLRWLGRAKACVAPRDWAAEPLFRTPAVPAALADFCLYSWTRAGAPSDSDVAALVTASAARDLTEDVPVLFPSAPPATAEEAFYTSLRTALRAQVGDAALLSSMPARPAVRVVIIDSAPDASDGNVHPGVSRHGDTLAHLVEDIVCRPAGDRSPGHACAAEVTTVLALPWIARGVLGPNGGDIGTLADLARAIERAVSRWQHDKLVSPDSTPARLILNLSLGWEHTPEIADCSADAPERAGAPARAVHGMLQYAASQGALIIAAAGNDSGGPEPRTGLVCPGRYQAVPQDADPSQALLVAVSGVDYADHPLETARPSGITGIAGTGLGGIAWRPSDPVPPQLTGSSVSTAVVSAVSALVWAQQPSWTASQVTAAVHAGGVDAGPADECPLLLGLCRSRRASVCGALTAAGGSPHCSPAAPKPWSSPYLPAEIAALAAAYASVPPSTATLVAPSAIPRHLAPTVQLRPSTFPAPISVTCRECVVGPLGPQPELILPPRGQTLISPVLVVRFPNDDVEAIALGAQLSSTTSYVFPVSATWIIQSAYLTGFEVSGDSVTEQIFVQQ
jgi:hypothetical protein